MLDGIKDSLKPKSYQARNLQKELKVMAREIKQASKDAPWKERVKRISELGGMAMAQVVDADEFAGHLHKEVGRAMGEVVLDLRSQIVKQLCAVLVLMSEELGSSFDKTIQLHLLGPLLKQCAVKALPIKASAWECLQALFSHRTMPLVIKPLVDETVSKEKIIRQHSMELVAYICAEWEPSAIQKGMGPILTAIHGRIGEADELVRESARNSVVSLAQNFPRAIVEFLRDVDPKILKLMEPDLPEEIQEEVTALLDSLDGGASFQSSTSSRGGGLNVVGAGKMQARRSAGARANAGYSSSRGGPQRSSHSAGGASLDPPNRSARGSASLGMGQRSNTYSNQGSSPRNGASLRSPTSASARGSSTRSSRGQASAMAQMDNVDAPDAQLRRSKSDNPKEFEAQQPKQQSPGDLLARLQELRAEVLVIQKGK